MCDLLIIHSEKGEWKYYFNKKYARKYADFKNYKSGFLNFIIEKTQSLPLKQVLNFKDSYLEMTIKNIEEKDLSDSTFVIPQLPRYEIEK